MAKDRRPRRRRRWIVPLVMIGAGAWVIRSRRARADPDPWLPPLPAEPPAALAPSDPVVPPAPVLPAAAPASETPAAPAVPAAEAPKHAAATPDAATISAEPTGEAPRHAAAPASSRGMPPTGMPPTGMPPTGMPPTGMPPTGMPPTGMPPTGMPANGMPTNGSAPAPPAVPAPESPADRASTTGALTSGTPNALFTPTAPTPGQGARPKPDGSAPGPEYTIKGNAGSKLFHTPASPYYGRTKAEVWFRTEQEAIDAGFTKWARKRPTSS